MRHTLYRLASLPPVSAVIFCGILYLLTLALLPRDYFWITDNDNKFLQVQSILSSGYARYDIPWTGQDIDPAFEFNPLPAPFSQVSGGRLYSIFSPVFAALSAVPYHLFGFRGLYLLPLFGSLSLLFGVSRIGALLGLAPAVRHAAVLLAGLATPVWFYSVVFWEHTIAVSCCVWAVFWLLKFAETRAFSALWPGCLLAALAVWFRDELYLFCLVFALAAVAVDARGLATTWLKAAAVMAAGLLPLWLFQGWAIGHPFGFHLGAHLFTASGIAGHLASRPQVFYNLFLAAHPDRAVSVLVTAPLILILLLPGGLFRRFGAWPAMIALGYGLVLAAVSLGGYLLPGSPIVRLLQTNSLLAAAPALVLAAGLFMTGAPTFGLRGLPLVHAIAAAYLVGYALAAPLAGSTGIHWGNRFVLVLYPLFALLAAARGYDWLRGAGRLRAAGGALAAALVLVSLAAQLYSCTLLARKTDFNHRLTQAVAARPEQVVVSTVWWAPQTLSRVFFEKTLFYAATQEQFDTLGTRLRANGIRDILVLTAAGGNPVRGSVQRIGDNGLGFFSLDLQPYELRGR